MSYDSQAIKPSPTNPSSSNGSSAAPTSPDPSIQRRREEDADVQEPRPLLPREMSDETLISEYERVRDAEPQTHADAERFEEEKGMLIGELEKRAYAITPSGKVQDIPGTYEAFDRMHEERYKDVKMPPDPYADRRLWTSDKSGHYRVPNV